MDSNILDMMQVRDTGRYLEDKVYGYTFFKIVVT